MRAINLRPSGAWRFALALLPFLALLLAYIIGSHIRLAENPNDKLLPSFADMGETIYAYAFEADPRTGDYLLWSDTAASLTRLLIGLAISASFALVVGILIGLLPDHGRDVRAVRRRAVDGAAAGAAADPVHRHGARRSVEDHADRHRHDVEADPRHRPARRRHPARATDQGADARRLDGADRLAHRAAADPAAAHRFRAPARSARPGCS